MKIRVEKQEFKGRPILALYDDDAKEEYKNYTLLTIGLKKAKAILSVLPEIEKFIKENDQWKKQ